MIKKFIYCLILSVLVNSSCMQAGSSLLAWFSNKNNTQKIVGIITVAVSIGSLIAIAYKVRAALKGAEKSPGQQQPQQAPATTVSPEAPIQVVTPEREQELTRWFHALKNEQVAFVKNQLQRLMSPTKTFKVVSTSMRLSPTGAQPLECDARDLMVIKELCDAYQPKARSKEDRRVIVSKEPKQLFGWF